jgi:hypothetical protein|tara:strand:+ start:925 stop:1503 length:579 start_codon:yes stop_codon:yes gene_type:complete
MNKLFLYLILFFLFLNIKANSNETSSTKLNYEQVINVGKMISHDKKFTLFFKTRKKAILARGAEVNYIKDYPQDLYYFHNGTGNIHPLITYDWFPKKAKEIGVDYNIPIFPEDFAYYLLSDNETLVMISGIKSISTNYKFNMKSQSLEVLPKKDMYRLRFVFSLLKDCGYKDIDSIYECSFYKPLISENLIN